MGSTPKIELRQVTKDFFNHHGQRRKVLDHLNLSVQNRRFAVLLGPSGCGKTTLLRIVAGLEQPDAGLVSVDGQAVDSPDRRRGMVFQSYTSFPWLTVLDNVLFGLRLTPNSREQQISLAHRFVSMVGLEDFENYYPNQLSGGMKQRVAIARTLAVDPDILLLDEPFGALDSQTRSLMHELLLNVWEANHKTVLFVTHDIEEALFLGDDVYVCSARPANIRKHFNVPFARPRDFSLRTSPSFIALRREVETLLRQEAQLASQTDIP